MDPLLFVGARFISAMLPNPTAVKLCLVPCMSLRIRLYSFVYCLIILLPNTLRLRASSLLGRLIGSVKAWVPKLCLAPGSSITSAQLSVVLNGARAGTEYNANMLHAPVLTGLFLLLLLLVCTLTDIDLQY